MLLTSQNIKFQKKQKATLKKIFGSTLGGESMKLHLNEKRRVSEIDLPSVVVT